MTARRGHPDGWSDKTLLAAVAGQDGEAFSAFYRRHLPSVLAYLMRETRDREQAADLAAEVFAAVLLSAGRYEPQNSSALPWVIGIARNKLLMSLRRGRIEVRARMRLGLEPIELDDEGLDRVERLADDGLGRLRQLLETLPELEREAVRSHVLDERDYRQIAADLRCSEMVVRKRVSRGLGRLRERFGEYGSV